MQPAPHSTKLDRRPVPLWVQGLLTGLALGVAPTALWALFTDPKQNPASSATSVLVTAAVIAVSLAVAAYLPLDPEDALERVASRRTKTSPAPAPSTPVAVRLHLVAETTDDRFTGRSHR